MKVLVPIKRVVDPYVKIRIKADGSAVETEQLKMVINPFDEIAIEEAVRWKEKELITEIVVVSLGAQAVQETLRNALALGADRALHYETHVTLEPLAVAKSLKAIALLEKPDLIIMGKQAIDDDCNQTGQMLSALLDWPQATFASKVVFADDKKSINVTREVDHGLETLKVQLPCVITTDLRLNEPRYATLPNIMKAKAKPLTSAPLATLDVDVTPRLKALGVTPPPSRKAGIKVQDVKELMHYLRDVEKVI